MSTNKTLSKRISKSEKWIEEIIELSSEKVIKTGLLPEVGPMQKCAMLQPLITNEGPGKPKFHLAIIISSQPSQAGVSIYDDIDHGILNLGLTLKIPHHVLDAMKLKHGTKLSNLFLISAEYQLTHLEKVLGSGKGRIGDGQIQLSLRLNKQETQWVIDGLEGHNTPLSIQTNISYRVPGPKKRISIRGNWRMVYDFIRTQNENSDHLTNAKLESIVSHLLDEEIIAVHSNAHQIIDPSEIELFPIFIRLAQFIFEKQQSLTYEGQYKLKARPSKYAVFDHTFEVENDKLGSTVFHTPLSDLLTPLADEIQWDQHLTIMVKSQHPLQPPQKIKKSLGDSETTTRNIRTPLSVDQLTQQLISRQIGISPSRKGHVMRPNLSLVHLPSVQNWQNIQVDLQGNSEAKSLPIISNQKINIWPDRLSSKKVWFAPDLKIVVPTAGIETTQSPFQFSFSTIGITNLGDPALLGTISFTVQLIKDVATSQYLENHPEQIGHQVVIHDLAITLLIPFIDSNDSELKYHRFIPTVERIGNDYRCLVELNNNWVRLAYGAMSQVDFQPKGVLVEITYAFDAYRILKKSQFELAFGGKASLLSANFNARTRSIDNSRTTQGVSLDVQGHEVIFADSRQKSSRTNFDASNITLAKPLVLNKPQTSATLNIRPLITTQPILAEALQKVQYYQNKEIRRISKEFIIPCEQFGHLYLEDFTDRKETIGCTQAFSLGEVSYRQYEEIVALKDPDFTVFRSRQQPGYFLVLPTRFTISRAYPDELNAYKPLIFLNAILDPDVADHNRIELNTTLQPDISTWKRKKLLAQLQSYHSSPSLLYPTDVATGHTFNLLVGSDVTATGIVDLTYSLGPFLKVHLSMDLLNWELIKTTISSPGVAGAIDFEFSDGTKLTSGILLKLDTIRGPWESGPLAHNRAGDNLHLTNASETVINVLEAVNFDEHGIKDRIVVEVSLEPSEEHVVENGAGLIPIYSHVPGTDVQLEEVRATIEDIMTNIVFINLVDLASLNLQRLQVKFRIQDLPEVHQLILTDGNPVVDLRLFLPLTHYLQDRIAEFQITKIFLDHEPQISSWISHNMKDAQIISITSDLLMSF